MSQPIKLETKREKWAATKIDSIKVNPKEIKLQNVRAQGKEKRKTGSRKINKKSSL